jgi:hypothetical protein
MRLVVNGKTEIESPTAEQVADALQMMVHPGCFATLSRADTSFVQCSGCSKEDFVVEYQEGGIENHFQSRALFALPELIRLFQGYLSGSDSFRSDFEWKKIDIGTRRWFTWVWRLAILGALVFILARALR